LLREGREAASYLCRTEEESEVHIIASRWLNICRTGLVTFEERLTLDDSMVEDEATQVGAGGGSSHATDKLGSSSKRNRHR